MFIFPGVSTGLPIGLRRSCCTLWPGAAGLSRVCWLQAVSPALTGSQRNAMAWEGGGLKFTLRARRLSKVLAKTHAIDAKHF